MTHNYWPLGTEADLKGEPTQMRALAKRYIDTAQEIERAAATLRRLGNEADGAWRGRSGEKFPDKAADLADRIAKAHGRYHDAGQALSTFAGKADQAQSDAALAAARARVAQQQIDANLPYPATPGVPATPAQQAAAQSRADAHNRAQSDLEGYRRDFHDAKEAYRRAAERAADAIKDAGHDDLKDSTLFKVWKTISGIVEKIALVVVAIAIICIVIVAILGTGGAILAAIAAIGAFMMTLGTILALATAALDVFGRFALGADISNLDLCIDAFAVLTIGLGKFFFGPRIAARAATAEKEASEAARVIAAQRALTGFKDAQSSARTLREYALLDQLAPDMELVASQAGKQAMSELSGLIKTAATSEREIPGALRLLLREDPAELRKLAAIAKQDPYFADALAQATGWKGAESTMEWISDLSGESNAYRHQSSDIDLQPQQQHNSATVRHLLSA